VVHGLSTIIRFFTTKQEKKRFEVQISELWTVDCQPLTINLQC